MQRTTLNFEINSTFRCDQKCRWCNRNVGLMQMPDCDLTLEDVERFKTGIRRSPYTIRRLKLCGGEPTLHPKMVQLVESFAELRKEGLLDMLSVATNGRNSLPRLPDGCTYQVSPLRFKDHLPHLVSPLDCGFSTQAVRACEVQKRCGRSFDQAGFTFCSLAKQFGMMFGIQVHDANDVVVNRDNKICRHCLRTLPYTGKMLLCHSVMSGLIPYPTKTFAKALGVEAAPIKMGGLNRRMKNPDGTLKMSRLQERRQQRRAQ